MSKEQNFSGPQTAMECQAVQEQLSAWLDGELAGARITAHLERCAACREEWRRLKALDDALGNLAAPVPPGLAEKVAAKIRLPRRRSWWQSTALAACLVLGIALGGTMARTFYGGGGAHEGGGGGGRPGGFPCFPPG